MATRKPHFMDTLFRRHARELRTLAERRVGGQEADDVVQEAFLRLAEVDPEHPVGNHGGRTPNAMGGIKGTHTFTVPEHSGSPRN